LLGRKSYDILGNYWPKQKGDPTSEQFDRITKYLASRNPNVDAHWQNTHVLGPDVVADLRAIKQGDGPALITQGSADFLKTLFSNDLVDEIAIFIFPLILGSGKRLFAEGITPTGLTLIGSSTSLSGVTINRYVRIGQVPIGTVGGVEAP
jgi:dihydrofolate reductase